MTFVEKESQTIGGFGRNDRFEYAQRFAGAGEIRNRVLRRGRHRQRPGADGTVQFQSYVGQFLAETGVTLGAEDEGPFEMRLLHFRRTFVEKMFAIHAKVEAFKRDGEPIGGYARHYYDLFRLPPSRKSATCCDPRSTRPSRPTTTGSARAHFPKSYVHPEA